MATHFPQCGKMCLPQLHPWLTCVPHLIWIAFEMLFFTYLEYVVTMATHFLPFTIATHFLPLSKKMCLAHLHPKANICAKFHENWWKTEEVVRDAKLCRYHGNALSATVKKNVSCTSTPQGKHLCQISWELVKNWGSSSRRKIFPIFAIICRYHGNTLSATVKKMCLAHLHPRRTSVPNFMRIGEKLRK